MKLTTSDRIIAAEYEITKPRPLGDLHERMKFLKQKASQYYDKAKHDDDWHVVWHAICDLETEVSFYEPKLPPFGRRAR